MQASEAAKRVLLLPLLTLALACGSADPQAKKSGGSGDGGTGSGGSAGGGGMPIGEPVPDTLAFSPTAPLTLAPTGVQTLTVVAKPAGAYTVHFALLGTTPGTGAGDASLDTSKQLTDASGQATVTLTAPSTPMLFNVRASVGPTLQTLLGVTVNGTSLTTLSVLHSYAGHRKVTEWTASIWEDTECNTLSGSPPPDGQNVTKAPANKQLLLSNVPVAKNLAVTLRAGHYVGGCANLAGLSEGGSNEVLVFAADRPINLVDTTLDVSFGFNGPSADFNALMASSIEGSVSALVAGQSDDVGALLDAMSAATTSTTRLAFDTARTDGTWDTALAAAYGKGAATRLRDATRRWLNAGAQSFARADTFTGALTPFSATSAQLTLASVAGLSPQDAGFALNGSSSWAVAWATDSDDNLLLGTSLGWIPSRLLSGLALAPALLDYPSASSVEQALAQTADCALVASIAVANGTSPGAYAYSACDETCIEAACVQATSALWQNARNSSASESATLSVTVTGASQVGDQAEVVSALGSWVGKLQIGGSSASTDGPFSASAP